MTRVQFVWRDVVEGSGAVFEAPALVAGLDDIAMKSSGTRLIQLFSLYATLVRERDRFARFSVIGSLGFLVDAGVLQLLITMTDLGPLLARIGSFAIAVLVTFALNRYWTFFGSHRRPWGEGIPCISDSPRRWVRHELSSVLFYDTGTTAPSGRAPRRTCNCFGIRFDPQLCGARDFVFAAPRAENAPDPHHGRPPR
jgi:hypothetical protein